jgi:hypothetical protein
MRTMDYKAFGRKGGTASWANLSAEQQKERVRKAGLARMAMLDSGGRSELASKAGWEKRGTKKSDTT